MKTTILCPVTQRIPAHKAHDKLIVRTAAALAGAGAHVVLLAPAPLPNVDELLDLYGAPRTANLELVPIAATPRFLYRGRLLKRASTIQAAAIYTSEFKI